MMQSLTPRLSSCSLTPRLPCRSLTPRLPCRSLTPRLPCCSLTPSLTCTATKSSLLCREEPGNKANEVLFAYQIELVIYCLFLDGINETYPKMHRTRYSCIVSYSCCHSLQPTIILTQFTICQYMVLHQVQYINTAKHNIVGTLMSDWVLVSADIYHPILEYQLNS